jgi:hypothetical protein
MLRVNLPGEERSHVREHSKMPLLVEPYAMYSAFEDNVVVPEAARNSRR